METQSEGRPYRSHKVPACKVCRDRKIRCHIDSPSQPCRFCRGRRLECTITNTKHQATRDVEAERPAKRARTNMETPRPTHRAGHEFLTSPDESSSLMVNPTMAEDIDVLERYLTSHISVESSTSRPYNKVSQAAGESIMYLTLPRHRENVKTAPKVPGRSQRVILEQVLHPFKQDVIELYFSKIHPCFPILDEPTFWELWHKDPDRISSTLMCDMYAISLVYWKTAERLRPHPCPDISFAWDQAVEAEKEDFVSPSMTSIHSAILDLSGRPVRLVINNVVNAGRMVTLAHSLGLHRDPSGWRATEAEKALRVRLWWGVLIHDYWSALAHGTPPNIHRPNYDVPLPTQESLELPNSSEARKKATGSFLHLCSLTQILGEILPLVYALHPDRDEMWKSIRRIECSLDDWEDRLPGYLKSVGGSESANGGSSLRFCFLSVKLLLCRVAFRATLLDKSPPMVEAKDYRFALLRESAATLADYIISLQEPQLQEFWLSYTAHLLVSATTILLRCTVESHTSKRACSSARLVNLMQRLQTARDVSHWDLADFCLERCREPVERIAAEDQEALLLDDVRTEEDLFLPVDSLDFPWETLWEGFEGPWPISI